MSETLPAASGGDGTLSYSLTGDPSWLTFTASSRRISGIAANASAIHFLTMTATDADGDTCTTSAHLRTTKAEAEAVLDSDAALTRPEHAGLRSIAARADSEIIGEAH